MPSKKLAWKEDWKQIWVPSKKLIHVPDKKLEWKEDWKQIWVPAWKEIWVPGWKKIWKPVVISEWFPAPDHHDHHHGKEVVVSSGDYGGGWGRTDKDADRVLWKRSNDEATVGDNSSSSQSQSSVPINDSKTVKTVEPASSQSGAASSSSGWQFPKNK